LLGKLRKKPAIVFSGVLLSVLPDIDTLAFRFGIPCNHMFGHRGISHSILFSLFFSSIFLLFLKQPTILKNSIVWIYLFVSGLSHGLLDAITNGGLGVGFFIPFLEKRYFFDYRPIKVSTLNLDRFFNGQGLPVIQSELLYLWAPAFLFFIVALILKRKTCPIFSRTFNMRRTSRKMSVPTGFKRNDMELLTIYYPHMEF
ncbi:metal-dependent hydrolase, partial [bacterium]|nr:metal-dependent hydrolase [bacterium]